MEERSGGSKFKASCLGINRWVMQDGGRSEEGDGAGGGVYEKLVGKEESSKAARVEQVVGESIKTNQMQFQMNWAGERITGAKVGGGGDLMYMETFLMYC